MRLSVSGAGNNVAGAAIKQRQKGNASEPFPVAGS
jgi:hypothetical protein